MAQLDAATLDEVAGMLGSARRVRVHGLRQYHAFASFLPYGLDMLRRHVAPPDDWHLGDAHAPAQPDLGGRVVVARCATSLCSIAGLPVAADARTSRGVVVPDEMASP